MNTKLTALVVVLIVTLALAACGGASEPGPAGSAAAAAAQPVPTTSTDGTDQGDMGVDSGLNAAQDQGAMAEDMVADDAMMDATVADDAMMGDAAADDAKMEDTVAEDAMMDHAVADDAMAEEAAPSEAEDMMQEPAMVLPAWLTAELIDVTSGQPFSISDYRGQVVLVETLAVWCSNCLKQQKEIQALHQQLGPEAELVSVGLDIDLNESADQLNRHAQRNGFDWHYAVATPDVAREIGQLYGNLFLNPPSTPVLIVDRNGEVHPLPLGLKRAQDLEEALAPFLQG